MKNVSGMTRGQGHEICNQIDNACKELGINGERFLSELIRMKFFFFTTKEFLENHIKIETFKVSDIFRHRVEDVDNRLSFSENFNDLVLNPNLDKLISIQNIGKLNSFTLPESMDTTTIQQSAGNPGNMTPEDFFLVIYLLIFEPEKAKEYLDFSLEKSEYYIFHVMVNGKLIVVRVRWNVAEWVFDAFDFRNGLLSGGNLFVSLATV